MIQMRIMGLEELLEKADPKLLAEPLRKLFTDASLRLERRAAQLTPKDTGILASKITHRIDTSPVPMWGQAYTNVKYAPYVEFDTRPHWPPIKQFTGKTEALDIWARHHHISAFVVARAIARRGTKGHHMFERAADELRSTIQNMANWTAREIEATWERR